MLKIAPIPDAAYEICTALAPDCRNTRHRFKHGDYLNSRNYGSLLRTTVSTYREGTSIGDSQTVPTSSYAGEAFSTSRSYYQASNNNLDLSENYGGTSRPNASYNERDENIVREIEEYEDGSEDRVEDVEDEYNNLAYKPANVTHAARSTVATFLQNQSAVSQSLL